MAKKECIFCKIASGQILSTKVYEDETVLAFLDIGPVSDGHTLVIPKEHYGKLHECPVDVLAAVCATAARLAKAAADAMEAEGYNVLCNNGRAAGQIVEHLHFHIIPRNPNDGVFDRWPAYEYEKGRIEAVAEKIRKNI